MIAEVFDLGFGSTLPLSFHVPKSIQHDRNMTRSNSPESAGHVFATHQAPYLQYLGALKSKWHEVRVLERHLRGLADKVKTTPMSGETRPQLMHSAAEIWDIQNDTGSISKPLTVAAILRPRSGNAVPKHVDNFLGRLLESEPDVNTRIIVFYSEYVREDCEAVASLLFCHILGVELNLRPADVSNLARMSGFEENIPALRRTPLRAGVVSFGRIEKGQSSIIAADLGPRKLGKGEPNIGKYSTHAMALTTRLTIRSCGSFFVL